MLEQRQLEGTPQLSLRTEADDEMVDNDINRIVALTSSALLQFDIYWPLAIKESDSTNSTTLTYTTVYFPAVTGTEDITTLWGGRQVSTPIDATFYWLQSMANSRIGQRSPLAIEQTQQDLLWGREHLERLALEAEREKVAHLTAKANLQNEILESMKKDIEQQILLHMRAY